MRCKARDAKKEEKVSMRYTTQATSRGLDSLRTKTHSLLLLYVCVCVLCCCCCCGQFFFLFLVEPPPLLALPLLPSPSLSPHDIASSRGKGDDVVAMALLLLLFCCCCCCCSLSTVIETEAEPLYIVSLLASINYKIPLKA